ncbi:hypothetical protein SCHPADRAFT_930180 [Schizopora paradoxa]|uniref:BTB domain-containing protein n=1 Tax=Schizopora paradoxa TaxID=27342 RepID=A0A0H2RNK8_9AGAM|nr:hypothetical protein SCHPADRAFT_930180 [Schizopora paradoxa]
MSTSGYYGDDDDDGNAQPNFQPYTLTSQNFRPEPIASGSHTSSVTKVPSVDSSPLHRGPIEAASDIPNAKPLPNVIERAPRNPSYPVDGNAGKEDLKRGNVGIPVPSGGVEMRTVRKDDMFYLRSLFIRVEGKPFSIPRSALETKSKLIQDMLSTSGDTGPGSSTSNPLVLVGMTASEFGHFLDALSEDTEEELHHEEWIDVLKVSFLLKADDVHKRAIIQLDDSLPGPVTRVELANKYDVPKWCESGYQALVLAAEPLSLDEAERIGHDSALKINRLREARLLKRIAVRHDGTDGRYYLCSRSQSHNKLFPDTPPEGMVDEINECYSSVFGTNGDEKAPISGEATPEPESPGPGKWRKLYNTSFAVFKVDDNLFRVPQHIFTEPTSTFTKMYSFPPEGEEDDNPVVLRDVEVDDFRAFLKCALKTFSDDEGQDVWLSAIKVSDLWNLMKVRAFAVSKLEKSEPDLAVRIELSRTRGIREWFRPIMLQLALRKEPPASREAWKLGWNNTILLFQLREKLCPIRKKIMENAMIDAEKVNATPDYSYTYSYQSARPHTCPFCRSKFYSWEWVTVNDETEAKDAKKAIKEQFPPDATASNKNGKGIDTQPLKKSPPSSIRAGGAVMAVPVVASSSCCCEDCCECCGDCLGDCCDCFCDSCESVCCCCC